jgi:hypothetical protein
LDGVWQIGHFPIRADGVLGANVQHGQSGLGIFRNGPADVSVVLSSAHHRVTAVVRWLKQFIEYVGGAVEQAPSGFPIALTSAWWGVWWGLLALAIVVFCGQTTKFIYIDF